MPNALGALRRAVAVQFADLRVRVQFGSRELVAGENVNVPARLPEFDKSRMFGRYAAGVTDDKTGGAAAHRRRIV